MRKISVKKVLVAMLAAIVVLTGSVSSASASALYRGVINGYRLGAVLKSADDHKNIATLRGGGIVPSFWIYAPDMNGTSFPTDGTELTPGSYSLAISLDSHTNLRNIRAMLDMSRNDNELALSWRCNGTIGANKKRNDRTGFSISDTSTFKVNKRYEIIVSDTARLQGTGAPYYGRRAVKSLFSEKGMALDANLGTSGKLDEEDNITVTVNFQIIDSAYAYDFEGWE